jgi:methionyl aminopeptidase
MIILKSPGELDAMRAAGRVAARILHATAAQIAPGVTTRELDHFARDLMEQHQARSAFLGYRGFPGYTCISINEEVVHGIPGDRVVEIGDAVSLDVGVFVDGWVGDNATTVLVGVTDPKLIALARTAQESLAAGIRQARPGGRLGDISHAIETVIKQGKFSVVRDFVGHGVGRSLHEAPQIPNYGPAGMGPKLRPGMTLAIEPMVNQGGPEVKVLGDGWTVVTRDRLPSVHVEHTVAITEAGPEILTVPPG